MNPCSPQRTLQGLATTILLLLLSANTYAQIDVDLNTTEPTTAPTTRRAVVIPPGFHLVHVGMQRVLCQEADDAWVRAALANITPTTRPSTMPTDLIQRLQDQRQTLADQLSHDLALPDSSAALKLIDEIILPKMRQLDSLDPHVIFLAVTREKLKSLMRQGWEDPAFRYNRMMDAVESRMTIQLAIDQPVDDSVLPVLYNETDTPDQRQSSLLHAIDINQDSINDVVSKQSQFLIQTYIMRFIVDQAIRPLKLPANQEWVAIGLTGILSAKHAAPIIGQSRQALLAWLLREDPRIPLKSAQIDLLHPADLANMRPEARRFYLQGLRRKSTLVVNDWLTQAGDDAAPKLIQAIRNTPPATPEAMLTLIRELTNIDLTDRVRGSF